MKTESDVGTDPTSDYLEEQEDSDSEEVVETLEKSESDDFISASQSNNNKRQ